MPAPQRRAVIITALPIERTVVLEHLRNILEEPPIRGSIYRRGIFDDRSDPWDIIVAEIGTGNEAAAAETERVVAHYTPDVAVFVGVAGAIKDLSHGDVVAATKVYNYEAGKDRDDHFEVRPDTELSGYPLLQRARYEAGEPHWRDRIQRADERLALATPPEAKVGPIAAGPKVLASTRTATFEFIRKHYGDAIAVEMEGHGFLLGVRMNHPILALVVRGISDRIGDKNPDGDLNWQPIAARHAAAFAFQVLARYFGPPGGGVAERDTSEMAKGRRSPRGLGVLRLSKEFLPLEGTKELRIWIREVQDNLAQGNQPPFEFELEDEVETHSALAHLEAQQDLTLQQRDIRLWLLALIERYAIERWLVSRLITLLFKGCFREWGLESPRDYLRFLESALPVFTHGCGDFDPARHQWCRVGSERSFFLHAMVPMTATEILQLSQDMDLPDKLFLETDRHAVGDVPRAFRIDRLLPAVLFKWMRNTAPTKDDDIEEETRKAFQVDACWIQVERKPQDH